MYEQLKTDGVVVHPIRDNTDIFSPQLHPKGHIIELESASFIIQLKMNPDNKLSTSWPQNSFAIVPAVYMITSATSMSDKNITEILGSISTVIERKDLCVNADARGRAPYLERGTLYLGQLTMLPSHLIYLSSLL